MNWYLIQTKPNRHTIASKNLHQQGFKVFLPLLAKTSRNAGKFVNTKVPLFTSYLFMGSSLEKVPWKSVNSTLGVSKAVTLDGTYRAVNREIIEGLTSRCDENGVIIDESNILPGDRVKIERGPLANFICQVEKIEPRKRVWLLIEVMQKSTRVQVSLSDLLKIS